MEITDLPPRKHVNGSLIFFYKHRERRIIALKDALDELSIVVFHRLPLNLFGVIHRADHRFPGMHMAACIKSVHDMLEM